jgi:hypothetical protein
MMDNKDIKKLHGYWGKYHLFQPQDEPKMIWIGPMYYEEMIEHFPEHRHNFTKEVDKILAK